MGVLFIFCQNHSMLFTWGVSSSAFQDLFEVGHAESRYPACSQVRGVRLQSSCTSLLSASSEGLRLDCLLHEACSVPLLGPGMPQQECLERKNTGEVWWRATFISSAFRVVGSPRSAIMLPFPSSVPCLALPTSRFF